MKRLLCAVILMSAALIISSWIGVTLKKKIKPKFLVSGSIMQTLSYCGGARPPQAILDSLNTPKGIPFGKLFIKSRNTNIKSLRIIDSILADSNGNFSIHLPPGDYCLVEEWKSRPFKLPLNDARHTVDSACFRNLYNTCDFKLRITNKNINHLKIVFHRACFYNQPCISYRGPLPSVAAPHKH